MSQVQLWLYTDLDIEEERVGPFRQWRIEDSNENTHNHINNDCSGYKVEMTCCVSVMARHLFLIHPRLETNGLPYKESV